jgi:hypothetical protein
MAQAIQKTPDGYFPTVADVNLRSAKKSLPAK